jgi:hypothetical protein
MQYMDDYDMINLVIEFGQYCPKFNTNFAESVKDYYLQNGEITISQRDALETIIKKWRIKRIIQRVP